MKRIIPLLSALVGLIGLGACALSQAQSDDAGKVLTRLGNTLVADLQGARAVDLAKTPVDLHGAACVGALPGEPVFDTSADHLGLGALAVAGAIQKVLAVTSGKPVGAFTVGAVALAFQPGSAQYNWAVSTLETSCIAAVRDFNLAMKQQIGTIAALPSILALGAAPLGM